MDKGTCKFGDGKILAREMCAKHYSAWRKYGDPLHVAKLGRPPGPVVLCSFDEEGPCPHPVAAHGLCDTHYRRWKKYGDPAVTKRILGDIERRWWSHVERRGDDECWPWKSSIHTAGYGEFGVGQDVLKAHVWGYEHFVGPMPEDKPVLDHKCHTRETSCPGGLCVHRRCVNFLPLGEHRAHLEPVTDRENSLRGRNTKLSEAVVAGLHARWLNGEAVEALALESGTHRTNLYKRFHLLGT